MILVFVDFIILLIILYVNYRKYKFSSEFNLKQNTQVVTIVFIILLYGFSLPGLPYMLIRFFAPSPEFFDFHPFYKKMRFPVYCFLGVTQIIYLFYINSKIVSKKD